MKLMKFIVLFSTFLIKESSTQPENDEVSHLIHRLPNVTVPYHYKIKLLPNIVPDNFTFDGELDVFFGVLKPTKYLTLNALYLKFRENSTNVLANNEKFVPSQQTIDNERQFLILSFENELQPGNYTLHLEYYGEISIETKNAFYISFYENDSGKKTFLATTHFETTQARRAFPSWDEPALKATFDISIKHFPNYTALSNMPVEKIINDTEIDGKLWTDFETTEIMSTYLICFVISDFKNISNNYGNFSIWSRENALDSIKYMYEIGPAILRSLEEYTNISYTLPKLDNIVIPHSPSGGTENWGLITYREANVLINEKSSMADKYYPILLVAHEFSHLWFGDLVGPAWWKDLWLNEGFARYMQYIIMDKVMYNERIMEFGMFEITHKAFTFDHLDSDPVSPDVIENMDLFTLFGPLTYEKGAALLHMLCNFLSEEIFHAGIVKYLQAHQFKSATADDLWESMQEALNEANVSYNFIDIKKIMDRYIYKGGYPTIIVTRNYTTGLTRLTQKNFSDKEQWWVPISFTTNTTLNFSSTLPTHWINPEKGGSLNIEGIDVNDWIILNLQRSAYCRVNYDTTNWEKIVNYMNTKNYSKIHVLNRAQLLDDAFYFYGKEELDLRILLELISYLVREVDYIPWKSSYDILLDLSGVLEGTPIYSEFQRFGRHLMSAFIADVGYQKSNRESILKSLARKSELFEGCIFDLDECLMKAKNYTLEFIRKQPIDMPTYYLRRWICKGLENANETIWNKAFDIYKEDKSQFFIDVLSCAKSETILQNFLKIAISSDTEFSMDERQNVIDSVFDKKFSIAWKFFVDNFNEVTHVFDHEQSLIDVTIMQRIRTTTQLNKVKEFLKQNSNFVGKYTEANIVKYEKDLRTIDQKISVARVIFEKTLQ